MALTLRHHWRSTLDQLRFEPIGPRVRGIVGGDVVIDTSEAVVAFEPRRVVPMYAVPEDAFVHGCVPAADQPSPPDLATLPPVLGPEEFEPHTCPGTVIDVRTASGTLPAAGFRPDDPDLGGRVLVDFDAFDQWLEEEQPRVGHPHDPYKRITVVDSARRVQVSLGDVQLADSTRTLWLLETPLPRRIYLPRGDVRLDLLESSPTTTTCAYKGYATYLSLAGHLEGRDLAWYYPDPLDDAVRVQDMVCFWAERTDLLVDGVPQPRPVTPWSARAEQEAAAARGESWA